ncbi:MAG: hypothetical protein J1F32_01010 [Erysipelotrichales bacterium]|nr:hypothetical protein [Erysipelotrichales bacterium]
MSVKSENKRWFKVYKKIVSIFFSKPKFVYLGEKISEPSLILSNHVGAKAPVRWEIYFEYSFRFWGVSDMTQGAKAVHKYLTTTYFHQKKHFNKFFAWLIGTIATPFVNLFYRGMNLIPTYDDIKFAITIRESVKTIQNGSNLIIFPEDSSKGYKDHLTHFFSGFVTLAETILKKGIDIPIFTAYYQKHKNTFVIDKGVRYSRLKELYKEPDAIALAMKNRVNELAEEHSN